GRRGLLLVPDLRRGQGESRVVLRGARRGADPQQRAGDGHRQLRHRPDRGHQVHDSPSGEVAVVPLALGREDRAGLRRDRQGAALHHPVLAAAPQGRQLEGDALLRMIPGGSGPLSLGGTGGPCSRARRPPTGSPVAEDAAPPGNATVAPRSLSMSYVKGTLAVALLVAVLVLAIQNRADVDVSFLFWTFRSPKILLILGTYLLGMFSGWGLVELIKRAF